jgi:hypothetical protein
MAGRPGHCRHRVRHRLAHHGMAEAQRHVVRQHVGGGERGGGLHRGRGVEPGQPGGEVERSAVPEHRHRRYAAGTREILECWFDDRPIPDEYLIVDGGKLAGTGAHSYSAKG